MQTVSTVYSIRKKMISLGSRLIACCKLAPTLARQMWRHNYVIDRNEYLIFTLSESVNPWVYSLQFLFKSTNNSWRYERKCEWVFFSEHSVETETFARKTKKAQMIGLRTCSVNECLKLNHARSISKCLFHTCRWCQPTTGRGTDVSCFSAVQVRGR